MRNSSSHTYALSAYDNHMCLKPPLLLWVAVLFLSKAITLPLAVGIGHVAGVNADALSAMRGLWSAGALLPSFIAAVLLYAFFRRVPSASRQVRWIWARGVVFLTVSAGMDLVLSLISTIRPKEIDDQLLLSSLNAAADAYFLLYILAARRVRDTFSEFPPPELAGV
jgi:hypothetical protein